MKFVWVGTSPLDWPHWSPCRLPTALRSRKCRGAAANVSSFQQNRSMVRCSCASGGEVFSDESNSDGGVSPRDSDLMWLGFGTWSWNRTIWCWTIARQSCMTFELWCNQVLVRAVGGEKRRPSLESHRICWLSWSVVYCRGWQMLLHACPYDALEYTLFVRKKNNIWRKSCITFLSLSLSLSLPPPPLSSTLLTLSLSFLSFTTSLRIFPSNGRQRILQSWVLMGQPLLLTATAPTAATAQAPARHLRSENGIASETALQISSHSGILGASIVVLLSWVTAWKLW